VKESLFNILPHDFTGLHVLDLFAGSGNVSIEALSRGATQAILVDESARSAAVIRDNLRQLGLSEHAQVWIAPVARSLRKLAQSEQRFDLVFLDPPYDKGLTQSTVELIGRLDLLNPDGQVVAEHSSREVLKPVYGRLRLNDQRRYGDTLLTFFEADANLESTAQGQPDGE
jgi:16S rRNA (guanine(966)-N(2))-methyltransferase RsmD